MPKPSHLKNLFKTLSKGVIGTEESSAVAELVKLAKKGKLPARKREAILKALEKLAPAKAKEVAEEVSRASSKLPPSPFKTADKHKKSKPASPKEYADRYKNDPVFQQKDREALNRRMRARSGSTGPPPPDVQGPPEVAFPETRGPQPVSPAEALPQEGGGGILKRAAGFAKRHPLATAGGALGLASLVAEPIAEGVRGMTGQAFDEELEMAVVQERQQRARDARVQRLQNAMAMNTARLAQFNPHLYNEALAGRRLPRGAVVLGGQPDSATLDELTMAMATSNPQAQAVSAQTQLQSILR
jgi:hypothetical protein